MLGTIWQCEDNGLFSRKFSKYRICTLLITLLQNKTKTLIVIVRDMEPPLWSSDQSFWLHIQRSRVRFPAPPDFLSSSGSGTGSTQPREVN